MTVLDPVSAEPPEPHVRHLHLAASASPPSSVEDLLAAYETWMRSWGAAPTTVRQRVSVIRGGIEAWGHPNGVRTVDLSDWLANPDYSQWTRVAYHNHVRSFFGWMFDAEHIAVNPAAKLRTPKSPQDNPRPLTPEEAKRAADTATGNLRAWLLLGLLAGLRAHEIAKLRGEDVNERTLYVLGKGQKESIVPTHPDLWDLAQYYPRRGYWFPARAGSKTPHIAGTSVTSMMTSHFDRLGIEGSIHRARHTFATELLRSGANIRVVQTLMRHTNLATTAKYTAVDENELAAALRALKGPA